MNTELSDEQKMIQAVAREFADKEVRPIAADIDREARFPRDTVRRMGELGLMGIAIPEAYGGSDSDTVAYAVALEEVAKACASHAAIMSVNNSLYCDPVHKFGTEEQKQRFLVPFASGAALGCFCLTEPEAGSDASNQTTLAVRDGGEYVLDGRKIFVTNGREAGAALVFAQTDRAKGHRGITAFLVEKGRPGFSVVKTEDKLGIRASDTAELLFESCRVPAANRLGEEGQGFKIAMITLDGGRIGIAAQAVGIAAGAYELSVAYARERKSFGQPIGQHQMVQWMLADMATTHRGGADAHVVGGLAQGHRGRLRAGRGHGQAVGGRDRDEGDHRCGSDPRRVRVHQGVPGGALFPRRQDHADLRGHLADPEARDRAAAAPRGERGVMRGAQSIQETER